VSTNTSGLSIRAMAEGCSDDFQRHFMGVHFFNPVRYMKLVEVIATEKTSPEALSCVESFCDRMMGKGVVHAKDTPNFIANRIGTFALFHTIRQMLDEGFTVEEVDTLTGPVIGHPKTATFRLSDLVGVDVLAFVAQTLFQTAAGDAMRGIFQPPEFLRAMVANKWLGDKTGQGFYKKSRKNGDSLILALDLRKMEYRPQEKPSLPTLNAVRSIESTAERLRALLSGKDRAGRFLWQTTAAQLLYSAHRIPEISDDIVNIDRAMRWGYNWELGPFETWDALGLREAAERMRAEKMELPASIEGLLSAGHTSFYHRKDGGRSFFDFSTDLHKNIPQDPQVILLSSLKDRQMVIKSNAGSTLLDMGEGVACLEFHSKMNAMGSDTISMMKAAVEEVEENFEGLVIGNHGANFSAGANLMLLLLEAQEENWDEIDLFIRSFQNTALSLRYSSKPVVAAPFGMALGGGCEVCLASDRIRASAETYMGLVELGVGLIPAGTGCKEMVLRAMEMLPPGSDADFFPYLKRAFETVAMAKVSTGAAEAQRMGFLRASDGITPNRDRLLYDAKITVLDMVREGYRRPEPRTDMIALGEPSLAALKLGVHLMLRGGHISEYDAHLGTRLARILTGGQQPRMTRVPEQHFLDLERETFLSLLGEQKTQERIRHMLETGKALRN
jgi:3-hydroxyacyl-CoA dehydrogenase